MARRKTGKGRTHGARSVQTFEAAVESVPAIAAAYRPGVQALEKEHRQRLKNGAVATGSIDLDAQLAGSLPNAHRWDYGIGLPKDMRTEKVLWLEVHHAASGETERVIQKLNALKSWLPANAPALAAMPRVYVWLLTNVENNPNDRRTRNAHAKNHGLIRRQGMVDLATI